MRYKARVYISRGEVNCRPARDQVRLVDSFMLELLEDGSQEDECEEEDTMASRDILLV